MDVYDKDIGKSVYGFDSIAIVGGDICPPQCPFTSVEESMVQRGLRVVEGIRMWERVVGRA